MKTVTFLIGTKLAILLACRMWGAEPPAVTLGFRTLEDMTNFTVRSTQTNLVAVLEGQGAFNFVPAAILVDHVHVFPATGVTGAWSRTYVYQPTNSNLSALASNPAMYQGTNPALTALAGNPSLYQATNALNLTPLAASTPLANKVWKTDGAATPSWRDDDTGVASGMVNVNAISDLVAYAGIATNINVLGYRNAGDGGGGVFYSVTGLLPAGSTNLGTAFNASGKHWLRIIPGQAEVMGAWFGAIPNDGVDDTAALQASIDYCYQNSMWNDALTPTAAKLVWPRGKLVISSTLTVQSAQVNDTIHICGQGDVETAIHTSEYNIVMMRVGILGTGTDWIQIENIAFVGPSNGSTDPSNTSIGLQMRDFMRGTVGNLCAANLGTGFDIDDDLNGTGDITELYAKNCGTAGLIEGHRVARLTLRAEACKNGWSVLANGNTLDILSQNITECALRIPSGRDMTLTPASYFENNGTNIIIGYSTNGVRSSVDRCDFNKPTLLSPTSPNANVLVYAGRDLDFTKVRMPSSVGGSVWADPDYTTNILVDVSSLYYNTSEYYLYNPVNDNSHGMSRLRNAFPDGACEYGWNVWATTVTFTSGSVTRPLGGRNNSRCVKMTTTADLDSPLCSFICTPAVHQSLLNKTLVWSMWVYADATLIASGATPRFNITDGTANWFPTMETATMHAGWNFLVAKKPVQLNGAYVYIYFYFDYNQPAVTVPTGAYIIVDDIVAQEWPGDIDKAARGLWVQDEPWQVTSDARWFGSGTPPFATNYTGVQLTQNHSNAVLQTIKGGTGTNLTLQLNSSAGTVFTDDDVWISGTLTNVIARIATLYSGSQVNTNVSWSAISQSVTNQVGELWLTNGITLGGVRNTTWPAGGQTNMMVLSITNAATLTPTMYVPGLSTTAASCRRVTERVTLDASVTAIDPPAGLLIDGDTLLFEFIQDAVGTWSVAGWSTAAGGYVFGQAITGVNVNTNATTHSFAIFSYNSTANKWYCTGNVW